jgi:predicted nucleotidyltransferase
MQGMVLKSEVRQPVGSSGLLGWKDLPLFLRESLLSAAREFREKGLELILFGSFAEGRAWPGSDLDMAYEGLASGEVERSLIRRIEGLETIRPIDLVPLSSASKVLAREIHERGIRLANLERE